MHGRFIFTHDFETTMNLTNLMESKPHITFCVKFKAKLSPSGKFICLAVIKPNS